MLRPLQRVATLLGTLAAATALSLALAEPAHAATFLTHAQATSQLSAAGISWTSSGGCSNRNNATCTRFDQVRQSTITGIKTLHSYTRLRDHHHGRHRDRARGRHLQPLERLQAGHQQVRLHHELHPQHVRVCRLHLRMGIPVPGALREPLHRRGQPLGHPVLHLRLLILSRKRRSPGARRFPRDRSSGRSPSRPRR